MKGERETAEQQQETLKAVLRDVTQSCIEEQRGSGVDQNRLTSTQTEADGSYRHTTSDTRKQSITQNTPAHTHAQPRTNLPSQTHTHTHTCLHGGVMV